MFIKRKTNFLYHNMCTVPLPFDDFQNGGVVAEDQLKIVILCGHVHEEGEMLQLLLDYPGQAGELLQGRVCGSSLLPGLSPWLEKIFAIPWPGFEKRLQCCRAVTSAEVWGPRPNSGQVGSAKESGQTKRAPDPDAKIQCCGAEIIYFRLRLQVQLQPHNGT